MHIERMATMMQGLEHMEPLERRVTLLERKVVRLANDILVKNHNTEKNRAEMNANVMSHHHRLVAHGDRLKVAEESTRHWDHL